MLCNSLFFTVGTPKADRHPFNERFVAMIEQVMKAAQTSYDKLTKQNTLTKTSNTEEVKGKEAKVKSEETALLNYKEDFATTGKELDAVLSYLDKLKPQCETKVMTYAERVAAREAEIA